MPKLSIIIPVYNVEKYIIECLDSIRFQTYRDYEVICIDDGSTDKSGEICKYYSSTDKRFRYIHQSNSGVSSARNKGIDLSVGRYIAFVDPDDYVSMNYYENMFKVMEEYSADIVESKSKLIAEDGRLIAERETEAIASFSGMNSLVVADGKGEIMDRITDNTFNCLSWNKLFKKSLWGDARYPKNLSLGEDMATVPEVVIRASKAVYTPDSVYFYRLRNTSLLHSNVNLERFKEDLQGSGIMRDALLSASPEKKEEIEGLILIQF